MKNHIKKTATVLSILGFGLFSLVHAQKHTVQTAERIRYTPNKDLKKIKLFFPGVISTGDDEAHVAFANEGKTLYFIKNTPTFSHWTIVVTKFKNGKWTTPKVAPFSGRYNDADVSFSPDGETLFFISNRPIKKDGQARKDTDIWKMEKTAVGWGTPEHLAVLSSSGNEWYPMVASDGTIYFGSERRKGNLGSAGTSDLYRSELKNGHYTKPENIGKVINTSGQDIEAYIAPDERFMIFASNGHEVNYGSYDLYISYRKHGKWTEPKNMGKKINSRAWDFGPKISSDNKHLFFTSNRGFFDEPLKQKLNYHELTQKIRSPKNGLRDIYWVDLNQIFSPLGFN